MYNVKQLPSRQQIRTSKVALVASLSALSVGVNYAMLPLPNVKLMDTIVFTTSLVFGFTQGAAVAAITWLIYGILNPLGYSLPILFTVILSEMIYAYAGYLLGKTKYGRSTGAANIERIFVFGFVGLVSTLAYDLATNAVSGLLAYNSIWLGLATMNFPIPLGIIHEASNLIFFALVVPILTKILRKEVKNSNVVRGIEGSTRVNTWLMLSFILAIATILTSALSIHFYMRYTDTERKYVDALEALNTLTYSVNILVKYNNGSFVWYNRTLIPIGWSLLQATNKTTGWKLAGERFLFGVVVTSINGVQGKGPCYWLCYRWDGEKWVLLEVGADQYILKQNEIVAWYLTDDWSKTP
jgi:uncharacterized membrane protein